MILGFKGQFVEPILQGTKIHTIREDPHDRWDVDKHIHMATGVRTSNYRCFKEDDVKGIQYVFMTYHRSVFELSVGDDHYCDRQLWAGGIERLAINDGFRSIIEFKAWFVPLIEKSEKGYYSGKIIHWTDFRY